MGYERAVVRRAAGYVPGKQPQSRETIKLNTNENPYPPCDAVMRRLAAVHAESLRRYPPPLADAFRAVAAQTHGLEVDEVIATNGGDELIRLALTTFVDPGRAVGVLEPSYSLYSVLAEIHGCPVTRVDANEDWSLPDETEARFRAARTQIVFVVNPHAPSGHLESIARLRRLAKTLDCVLVIDEAYVDFVDPSLSHDATPLVHEFDNVILLRTLSKGYSLAGLRFGYGLGARDLVSPMLTKTRDSYNVDAVAQALAIAALEHREDARVTWGYVRRDRERLRDALAGLGLKTAPSQTNFVLATVPPELGSAEDLCLNLEERGVLVRHFPAARLRDCLRITVGTPEENARLLAALGEVLRG